MVTLLRVRWSHVVLALTAVMAAGCAGASRPAVSLPPRTAHFAHTPVSSQPVELDVNAKTAVAFSGDLVSVSVSALDSNYASKWPLAQATLNFGDGVILPVTQPCARAAPALAASHVYHRAGEFSITVQEARFCDSGATFDPDSAAYGAGLQILPSAPPGTGSWPPCAQRQVQISAQVTNAAIGNRVLLFPMRNISRAGCTWLGYPGLVLVRTDGSVLRTSVQRGGQDQDGLFPALTIQPHLVALAAGATASFAVGYGITAMYKA